LHKRDKTLLTINGFDQNGKAYKLILIKIIKQVKQIKQNTFSSPYQNKKGITPIVVIIPLILA
jgi:hypothetical protein